jgi:hypothetical protein
MERPFDLSQLQSEHEQRAHSFLDELKTFLQSKYPEVLLYAYDATEGHRKHFESQVRFTKEVLQSHPNDPELMEILEIERRQAAEIDERSTVQTEICVGLGYERGDLLSEHTLKLAKKDADALAQSKGGSTPEGYEGYDLPNLREGAREDISEGPYIRSYFYVFERKAEEEDPE